MTIYVIHIKHTLVLISLSFFSSPRFVQFKKINKIDISYYEYS